MVALSVDCLTKYYSDSEDMMNTYTWQTNGSFIQDRGGQLVAKVVSCQGLMDYMCGVSQSMCLQPHMNTVFFLMKISSVL